MFFLFIGTAIDYLYFDAFTPAGPAFPIATIFSLGFATFTTLTAYYGGSDIILSSLGAEKLNLQIPEHRELHNIVTEMALASGSPMPRIFVIFDPAPNALATGHQRKERGDLCDGRLADAVGPRRNSGRRGARDLAYSQ